MNLYEHRMEVEVRGKRIAGVLDVYEDGVLSDYKVTSLWSVKGDEPKAEWVQQLNLLAEMARREGLPVTKLQIVAILRDHNRAAVRGKPDLPRHPIAVVPIEMWESSKATAFLEERVAAHVAAREGDLQPCTDEERWVSPTVWALKKRGRKSAVKLHRSEDAANRHAEELGTGHYVEHRPGEARRCAEYCPVAKWCDQYQNEQA
jgi:hypothetical protein